MDRYVVRGLRHAVRLSDGHATLYCGYGQRDGMGQKRIGMSFSFIAQ